MAEGLEQWIFLGIDKAMNFINTQKKEEKP
jgi:hypothetical protein